MSSNMIMKRSSSKTFRIIAIILAIVLIILLNMSSSKANNGDYNAVSVIHSDKKITTAYKTQNNFGGNTYTSVAFDFHIFADEVTLGGHTNGNIAANTLYANGQAFGAKQNITVNNSGGNHYLNVKAADISGG